MHADVQVLTDQSFPMFRHKIDNGPYACRYRIATPWICGYFGRCWWRNSSPWRNLAFLLTIMIVSTIQALGIEPSLAKEATIQEIGDVKSLDIYVDSGVIRMLIADYQKVDDRSYLWYIQSVDAGKTWSKPVRVDKGSARPYARGRGTDFHLAAAGNHLVAVWMTKGTGFMGRGPLVTAYSEDGGRTWQPGTTPADDGTEGDHAFIDVAADPEGNFHVVWLDKRSGSTKGLYSSRSTDGGKTWAKNSTVDPATCDCCWNVLTTDSKGNLYALYRDLEPRDMALAISPDSGLSWNYFGFVGEFSWDFNGCPHVGGGIAVTENAQGRVLHSVVWTGKEGHLGLYYLQSGGGRENWTPPKRLGTETARFPDIAAGKNEDLAVVWEDYVNEETAIFSSISTDNGKSWSAPEMQSALGVDATHPRVVVVEHTFHVFWTETVNGKSIWKHRIPQK